MNKFSILVNAVPLIISIIAVLISKKQLDTTRQIAAPMPFLIIEGAHFKNDKPIYIIRNIGPGHAKNIKIHAILNNKIYNFKGQQYIPFEDQSRNEVEFEGEIILYPDIKIIIQYESMTKYRIKNEWTIQNGEFKIS